MNEFMREALIGCLGAFISAVFTYRSSRDKDSVDREDVYADHTPMLWDKIDQQSKTIEEQSKTIDALTRQVEKLRTENARLTRQVTKLTAQVSKLSRGSENAKNQ